ncbi:MAG: DUF308 domain-containing protein [Lachnospiraceae bacterium]|nr:DUF308 domain-containing protein [Lachnospiraceae bacterium]
MSIIFYIAGVLYMVLPGASPMVACISSGIILAAYGIIKIIGYLSDDLYCLAFQYDLGCGLFLIVLGAIVLCLNLKVWQYLQPALGMLILLDGLMTIQTSKDSKKFGLETWHWILTCAVIASTFGALVVIKSFWGEPSRIVNGCAILAEGFMNHLLVKSTVIIMNNRFQLEEEEE